MPLGLIMKPADVVAEAPTAPTSSQCVKCPKPGTVVSSTASHYCVDCFVSMVEHKFKSALGKNRVFRPTKGRPSTSDGEEGAPKVLVVYDGTVSSAALLHMMSSATRMSSDRTVASRRLHVVPHVCVLVTDDSCVDVIVEHMNMLIEQLDNEDWTWSCVHVASVFMDSATPIVDEKCTDTVRGAEHATSYSNLISTTRSCLGVTVSTSLADHVRLHCLLRLAREGGMDRVILSDTMDTIARGTFNAMCTGRGASIANMSSVVDLSYGNGTMLVRPLRDVSIDECAKYAYHTRSTALIFPNPSTLADRDGQMTSIADVTDDFFTQLQAVNHSTAATVLATANKLTSALPATMTCAARSCPACFTPIVNEEDRFCIGCMPIVDDEMIRSLMPKGMLG